MPVVEPIRIDAPLLSEPPSWLEIDLGRLEANVQVLRAALEVDAAGRPDPLMRPARDRKPPLLCGVVKKNAYGLGIEQVSQRLVQVGVDILAVYGPDDADLIIRAAVNIPILLLMPLRSLRRTDPLYRAAETGRLHLTVHDMQQLDELNSVGQTYGLKLPIHLHLDTGMSRSGLDAEQFVTALQRMPTLQHLRLRGIYSHLATAGSDHDYAYRQLDYFEKMIADHADRLPDSVVLHLANTCGTYRDRRFHMDMVRIGLGLYGYGPETITAGPIVAEAPILRGTVRWVTRFNHLQRFPAGASVGYDCTHTLKRDSILGIVPVGYGDGYPLALSNKAMVSIPDPTQGKAYHAPILGRVNMDQLVVDLTEIAEVVELQVGTLVELISNNAASPCSVPHLAEQAQSHSYEMLCRLGSRLPRRYVKTAPIDRP